MWETANAKVAVTAADPLLQDLWRVFGDFDSDGIGLRFEPGDGLRQAHVGVGDDAVNQTDFQLPDQFLA